MGWVLTICPISGCRRNRLLFERRVKQMIHLAEYGGGNNFVDDAGLFANTTISKNSSLITQIPSLKSSVVNHVLGLQTPQFFLHYGGGFDRPLQELVSEMHILLGKDLLRVAPHLEGTDINSSSVTNVNTEKKKIAFVRCVHSLARMPCFHPLVKKQLSCAKTHNNLQFHVSPRRATRFAPH